MCDNHFCSGRPYTSLERWNQSSGTAILAYTLKQQQQYCIPYTTIQQPTTTGHRGGSVGNILGTTVAAVVRAVYGLALGNTARIALGIPFWKFYNGILGMQEQRSCMTSQGGDDIEPALGVPLFRYSEFSL